MNSRSFALQPFPQAGPGLPVVITGSLTRRAHKLTISYELHGQLAALMIPRPAERPARRDGLWEDTCLEFFLAARGSASYWEFNLSPSGHWQVYRFAGYRQGRQEEAAFHSLPFRVQQDRDTFRLALEVEVAKIIPPDQALELAVAAVIQIRNGEATYWALAHRGLKPDFHRRDSFIIQL
jgi:hypothetical protein